MRTVSSEINIKDIWRKHNTTIFWSFTVPLSNWLEKVLSRAIYEFARSLSSSVRLRFEGETKATCDYHWKKRSCPVGGKKVVSAVVALRKLVALKTFNHYSKPTKYLKGILVFLESCFRITLTKLLWINNVIKYYSCQKAEWLSCQSDNNFMMVLKPGA